MKVYKIENESGDFYCNKDFHGAMEEVKDLVEYMEEDYSIKVSIIEMTEKEYDELPEFEGF